MYWAITSLDLLNKLDVFKQEDVIAYVLSCRQDNGGFGGHVGHDAHLLYTLSAIQILAVYDRLDLIGPETVECMSLSLLFN